MYSIRRSSKSSCMTAAGILVAAAGVPFAWGGTWTVSNLNNTGQGSLRWAVEDATDSPESDTIVFDSTLNGTIVLDSPLTPAGTIVFNGPGARRVAVSGNNAVRVIVASNADLTINDLTIRNGRSPSATGSEGGGIRIVGGTLRVNRCMFRDNIANAVTAAYGGAIYAQNATVAVDGCTFFSNSTTASTFGAGGAFALSGGSGALTSCTFTTNNATGGTVSYGGAVYVAGPLTIDHCTIANNTVGGVFPDGGGIAIANGAVLTLGRTLLFGNGAGNMFRSSGTLVSNGFNFDSDGSSGLTNGVNGDIVAAGAAIDAKLSQLADNGGPTLTMALQAGSPAIDAVIATTRSFDQRGYPRAAEGDCSAPASADIGAYEYSAGRGLNFDAVDDYADLSTSPQLNLLSVFTLEAWVRADSYYDLSGMTRILSKRSASNTGFGFGQTGGRLVFTAFGRFDYITTAVVVPLNQWVHVAVVFDSNYVARFYVNGQFVQAVAGTGPVISNSMPLYIGRNPTASDLQMWDGAISDVRIWNTTRSAADIWQNYNRTLDGTEPGLLAYYKLDEGATTTVFDAVVGGVAYLSGNPAWITGVPCPCMKGDANCDAEINFFDIDPFVLALFSLPAYQSQFCGDTICPIDMDCSGEINFFDIDPFVASLFGEAPPCP